MPRRINGSKASSIKMGRRFVASVNETDHVFFWSSESTERIVLICSTIVRLQLNRSPRSLLLPHP